jgi:hypothetical protein
VKYVKFADKIPWGIAMENTNDLYHGDKKVPLSFHFVLGTK